MRVAIVGAGSIGGLIGARLAALGAHEVSALARGATLQGLQTQGWRLHSPDGDVQVAAKAEIRSAPRPVTRCVPPRESRSACAR